MLGRVIRAVLQRHEETYHRIWEESRGLVQYLREVEAPIPEIFRLTAQHVLEERVAAELAAAGRLEAIPARVFELIGEATALGLTLDLGFARPLVRQAVQEALGGLERDPSPERVAAALALVEGARRAGLRFGLWAAQNRFFALWSARPEARPALTPIATVLGFDLTVESHS